jgi:hypothetical protein
MELVSKKKKIGEKEMKRAVRFAKGMPSDPDQALEAHNRAVGQQNETRQIGVRNSNP